MTYFEDERSDSFNQIRDLSHKTKLSRDHLPSFLPTHSHTIVEVSLFNSHMSISLKLNKFKSPAHTYLNWYTVNNR